MTPRQRLFEPISPKINYIYCSLCDTTSNAGEPLDLFTAYELHVFVTDYNVLETNFTAMYNNTATIKYVYVCMSISINIQTPFQLLVK